jgi:hypothetical protein
MFWDSENWDELIKRIVYFVKPKNILIALSTIFIIFLPQMLYWYALTGSPIIYSYENESFTNVGDPKILEVLFSPSHGVLWYSPIVLFMWLLLAKYNLGNWNRNITWTILGVVLVFYASWSSWSLGMGFGHRAFIEYQSILCLPLGLFFQEHLKRGKFVKTGLLTLLLVLAFFNIYLTYQFDGWYGKGDWDWSYFTELLLVHK